MKKIIITAALVAMSLSLFAQDLLVEYGVEIMNEQVCMQATPQPVAVFQAKTGMASAAMAMPPANAQVTTGLITFTLPAGTMTVPGIAPGGMGNFNVGDIGTWKVFRITAAQNGGLTVLQDRDVYVASFTSDPGLDVNLVEGQSLDLFCFNIYDGCNGGGTIDILDNGSAEILELNPAFMSNFNNQFSALFDTDPTCVKDIYVDNVDDENMLSCPPPLVPTMGQWALFLFGLIVFTLGIVVVYNISRAKQMA